MTLKEIFIFCQAKFFNDNLLSGDTFSHLGFGRFRIALIIGIDMVVITATISSIKCLKLGTNIIEIHLLGKKRRRPPG